MSTDTARAAADTASVIAQLTPREVRMVITALEEKAARMRTGNLHPSYADRYATLADMFDTLV